MSPVQVLTLPFLEQDLSSELAHMNCMSSTRHFLRHSIAWMDVGISIAGPTMPSGPRAPRSLVQVRTASHTPRYLPPVAHSGKFIDHDAHKNRRHAIASFFSKRNVLARQEVLHRNIDKLCGCISKLVGTSFNLGAAISAFARDTANEFIVGKAYNELDLDDFGIGLSLASQGAGVFWRTTKHVRWFGPAIRALPIDWVMKISDEGTKSFLRYLQVSC